MKFIKKIFLSLLFLVSTIIEAQELPPIENFSPQLYGADNQNWSISQGNDLYVYVANNSGLLEFNGAKWKLYPSPNNTSLRAVNVIESKIYTGCFREFGFWERNEMGNLEYHSLIHELNEPLLEDEHIWNIISFDKWILFQSLRRIYIYNIEERSFNIIKSDTHLPKVFRVEDSIYFQRYGEGVFKIENGKPLLISDDPIFKDNILVNIFSINNKVLFQTQEKGFYFLDAGSISKWDIPANKIIASVSVFSSLRLRNGSFVLGTIRNGIYQLNEKGEIINQFNQNNGLSNNTILSMFEDKEQNLWLGLDNGISMINFNSPFSVFNDLDGKLGSVYAAILFNNNLYIGTNQGLFYKKNNSDDFQFIEGTYGQVWCLKVFDNTLFCGHNLGTFVVDATNKANLITNAMGTWDIIPIKNNNNLLLQGHYNGLNVIEKINNKWQFRNKIEGFNISSRYFGFDSKSNIFVSHEWKGVFKLHVNNNFTKILDYTIEESVHKEPISSLITYNNHLLYTSNRGVYKYEESQSKFLKDSLLSINIFANDDYVSGKLITNNKEKTLWGFTDKNIVYCKPAKLDNDLIVTKISLPASLRKFVLGYENVTQLNDQIYLFGSSNGYILLDLDKLVDKEYEIFINSIEKSILNKEKEFINVKNINEFKYEENNLYFNYSVPEFDKFDQVNYQYQLKGIYNEWSDWSENSEISFKNLPWGDYTFNVRAKIGSKLSKNTATYSFTIKRPLVLSNQMLFIYLILLSVLLFLIHVFYKRYYNKQKQKLIEKKQRVFAIAQLENEQEIMKLKNEKLQNDIESKSRELGTSTMSIIKKNEILNTIKEELTAIKDESHVEPVLKIINKNLSNSNDWELFKEAFNNADSDFLKKVKKVHPLLTPNDLRLCAYLRLNLSSKEIAPLLNISPRSVEIKRYRLRKKMDLPHEKSLVEYILGV
ncbi:triple tyrosine motif-containing protein [Lutibacter sp.]|uniref:helix-turn-helix and ligand-binding sensor domain-containing protein n=1 Tax=Lutibacter sp. TaxID=1925666 RepID=UPI0035653285